ncbi:MAG: T9SS type A sorting domain-containing protein [Bacteroidetes bacterium]|nr:T9SS type A sorting domain-containing protein [Bacteroidota bacterium]
MKKENKKSGSRYFILILSFIIIANSLFSQWKQGITNSSLAFFGNPMFYNKEDSVLYLFGTGGIYSSISVSRDSLKSWKPLANAPMDVKYLVAKDNYIVAYGNNFANPCVGIYVSADFGNSWSDISTGLINNTAGCAVRSMVVNDSIVFIGNVTGRIYKRNYKNPLSTWAGAYNGIDTTCFNQQINSLESYNSLLFAGTSCSGFYVSNDNGQSWISQNVGIPISNTVTLWASDVVVDYPYIYIATSFGGYTSQVGNYNWVFQPILCSDVFDSRHQKQIGGCNYRQYSLNNGASWIIPKNDGRLLTTGVNDVVVFANQFVVNDYGIHKINLADSTWESHSYGTPGPGFYDIKDIIKSSTKLLSISKNGGLYSSSDTGKHWTPEYKLKNIQSNSLYSYDSLVFLCSKNGIYRSADYGSNWSFINSSSGISFNKMIKKSNTLIAGSKTGIYLSNDNGNTWTMSTTVFNPPEINDILINIDSAYCATNKGIYRSTNDGISWQLLNNNLKDSLVSVLYVNNINFYGATKHTLFNSSDNLINFSSVFSASSVISDFIIADSTFLLASDSECYIRKKGSLNWGKTWLPNVYANYPKDNIYSLNMIDSIIFGTSLLKGICYMKVNELKTVGIKELSQQQSINTIVYPNPANKNITILFTAIDSYAILVYNMEGKKVIEETVFKKKQIDLYLEKLNNGIYLIKIIGPNNRIENKKLIIQD